MKHSANADFWDAYNRLPVRVQRLADKNHKLLVADPNHPSLHFKKVGRYWSVRASKGYRALARLSSRCWCVGVVAWPWG